MQLVYSTKCMSGPTMTGFSMRQKSQTTCNIRSGVDIPPHTRTRVDLLLIDNLHPDSSWYVCIQRRLLGADCMHRRRKLISHQNLTMWHCHQNLTMQRCHQNLTMTWIVKWCSNYINICFTFSTFSSNIRAQCAIATHHARNKHEGHNPAIAPRVQVNSTDHALTQAGNPAACK